MHKKACAFFYFPLSAHSFLYQPFPWSNLVGTISDLAARKSRLLQSDKTCFYQITTLHEVFKRKTLQKLRCWVLDGVIPINLPQVSFLTFLYSSECVYSSGKRVLFFFVFLVGDRGEYSICTEPWRFKAVFIVAIFFYFLFRV